MGCVLFANISLDTPANLLESWFRRSSITAVSSGTALLEGSVVVCEEGV
jgi:hypothetical protein